MSATLLACYRQPDDPAAFDQHYEETHAPLGRVLPGVRSFTGTKPGPGPDGAPPAYYFVAVLTFDDEEAVGAALAGPEGEAAVADLANFAGAGVDLMSGPTLSLL